MKDDQMDQYGEDYYRHCCGPIPYDRDSPHYIQFFQRIADWICENVSPKSAIDIGCAMGFLVEALRDRDVEAYGLDISDYAISRVRDDIKPYCRVASATNPLDRDYDLAICIEVLEHLPKKDGITAIRNMTKRAQRILFSSSPTDVEEHTHINVQPVIYWLKLFHEEGFFPDFSHDLSSIVSPQCFMLKRSPPEVLDEQLPFFAQMIERRIEMIRQQQTLNESQEQLERLRTVLGPHADTFQETEQGGRPSSGLPGGGSFRDVSLRKEEEIRDLQLTIQTQDFAILMSPFARRIYNFAKSIRRALIPATFTRFAGKLLSFRLFKKVRSALNRITGGLLGTEFDVQRAIPARWPNIPPLNLEIIPDKPHRLNVLIPGLQIQAMSGGPNTAINLTLRLAKQGMPVRYISTDIGMEPDPEVLYRHFQSLSEIDARSLPVEMTSAHDRSVKTEIGFNDVFLCTAWWTVQAISPLLNRMEHKRFIYLIQEYEPGLYPWSSEYAQAMMTYAMDFQAVINESLVKEYLVMNEVGRFSEKEFADRCLVFEPAVDRKKFFAEQKEADSPRRLLFYARPDAPRNLFKLGLLALRTAVERGAFAAGQWELVFLGGNLPDINLGRGVTIRSSPWLNYESYAYLMRQSDVGLSLMLSPHTSYPPLEMAASGMIVVTNDYSVKSPSRLSGISGNIIPAKLEIESLVKALIIAGYRAENTEARTQRSLGMKMPRDWDESFRPIMAPLVKFISDPGK